MYLLGIDIGSSSEKAAVFDYQGNMIALSKTEYPIFQNQDGRAEQDAEDYYTAFLQNLGQIDKNILEKVTALCICGQTPTDIFVDKSGRPLCRAIMWRDTRAKVQYARQRTRYTFAELEEMAGCPIPKTENWTTLRMGWLKDNEPALAQSVHKVLQPKDYLIYRLSGRFVTDLWSARCFANVHTGVPNKDLLAFWGFDESVVPPIFKVADVCAYLDNEQAEQLGLRKQLKIVCGSSDGFAAMLSSGILGGEHVAFNSTGTSEMAGIVQTEAGKSQDLYIFPASLTEERAVCFGPTQSGGASLIWLAQNVLHVSFEEMIALAEKSVPGSHGLVFLPYINGERAPIWDSDAKGCFFGIKSSHTDSDFARSALEGVAFSIRSILESAGQGRVECLRLLGGGSQIPLWCQIRADVLGAAVETVACQEACAQGAAMIAGIGDNVYDSYRQASVQSCRVGARYLPDAANKSMYDRYYGVYKGLYQHTKAWMQAL